MKQPQCARIGGMHMEATFERYWNYDKDNTAVILPLMEWNGNSDQKKNISKTQIANTIEWWETEKKWAEFVMKLRREKERQLSWMSIGATQRCATKLLGALRKLIDKRISHPTDDWQFEFDRKLNWNAWKCMPISGFIFFPHSHNFYPFLSIWWLKGMKQDGKKYQSGM